MSVNDIITKSYRVYRASFWPLFLTTLAYGFVWVVVLVASVILMAPPFEASSMLLLTLAVLALHSFYGGFIARFVGQRLIDREASTGTVIRETFGCLPGVAAVQLLRALLVLAVGAVVAGLFFALSQTFSGSSSGSAVGGLPDGLAGLLSTVVVFSGAIAVIPFVFSIHSRVHESASIINALRRSWTLTRGHRLRIVGAHLYASLIVGIITGPLVLIAGAIFGEPFSLLASALCSVLGLPFVYGVWAVFYFSVRGYNGEPALSLAGTGSVESQEPSLP